MKDLKRRVKTLEGGRCPMPVHDPVLLISADDDPAEALAAHEAVHGRSGKEPFFVRLVGVKPGETHHAA